MIHQEARGGNPFAPPAGPCPQQQCVALQAFGRAWGAQYERRCREKQRHDRRVTAALETQRLARVMARRVPGVAEWDGRHQG